MNINYTIELEDFRCNKCGLFWASEKGKGSATCPFCAEGRRHQYYKEINAFERRVSALRGVITRLKK